MIQDIGEGIFSNAFSLAPPKDDDLLFCFRGGDVLLRDDEGAGAIPRWGELKVQCHHIFFLESTGCYLAETDVEPPSGYFYKAAPAVGRTHPDKITAFASVTAWQLSKWETSRRFCGKCGAENRRSEIERAMVCPVCGQTEYPKISPAIITAVSHNGKLLMAKGINSERFALIAGFVEIGETFEETVKREVMEEVGQKVKNIKYFKSQPWAFSDTEMIGFTCELDGEEVPFRLQETEIADARWFAPDEIAPFATNISIASDLVRHFIETNSGK